MEADGLSKKLLSGALLLCAAFASTQALEGEVPAADFWFYLLEFGDDGGRVVDPLEFANMGRLQDIPAEKISGEQGSNPADLRGDAIMNPPSATAEETLQ